MAVQSVMLDLGTSAPEFSLVNTNPSFGGAKVTLSELSEHKALLIAFWCNHCPYVIHIRDKLVEIVTKYQGNGLEMVAVCANDAARYPDDSPENMSAAAIRYGYTFPYLHDETQAVALAYQAACTPDFYLFDGSNRLVYRGQFDSARPGNDQPVTGSDLCLAIENTLDGKPVAKNQNPSMGCGIKWKIGHESK